jgi:hypothetical protein
MMLKYTWIRSSKECQFRFIQEKTFFVQIMSNQIRGHVEGEGFSLFRVWACLMQVLSYLEIMEPQLKLVPEIAIV